MAEIIERVSALETTSKNHENRLFKAENDIDSIRTGCAGSMATIETKVTDVLNNNKTMIKVLTYAVVTLLTILGSLFGVKIVDPQLLTSFIGG